MPPQEPAQSSGIKWDEVTWYSKLGAIILFVGIVPVLCFYTGVQYEAVKQLPSTSIIQTRVSNIINQTSKDISVTASSSNNSFSASASSGYSVNPTTGPAPLQVSISGQIPRWYRIDYGDGSPVESSGCSDDCFALALLRKSHVYKSPGTYVIKFLSTNGAHSTTTIPIQVFVYTATTTYVTDDNTQYGFSLQYSSDLRVDPVVDFASSSLETVFSARTISYAEIIIGRSSDPAQVANCLTPPKFSGWTVSDLHNVVLNGTTFLKYHVEALTLGPGHIPEEEYRAVHGNACWTIHMQYDGGTQIPTELDDIAQSFRFK